MKNRNNAIEVKNMTKSFKLFYDKPNTLKERLVFWNKKKADTRTVLDNINLDVMNVYGFMLGIINFLNGCDALLEHISDCEADMRSEYGYF